MSSQRSSEEKQPVGVYAGYLENSSTPLTCFFFALPLFLVYHGGLWWLSSFSELRWANAADIAIANTLGRLGMVGPLISFIATVVVFLSMHALSGKPWHRPSSLTWLMMIVESFIFALPVFMLSRLVMSLAAGTELSAVDGGGGISWQVNMILSCGAGVYEEFLFRLLLMGMFILILDKVFRVRSGWKYVLAALLQAFVFAASHHLPGGPEAITGLADFQGYLPVFAFRTAAGVYFAFLYVERGFGIAAGSHALYDLLIVALELLMPGLEI